MAASIETRSLSKRYVLGTGRSSYGRLSESLANLARRPLRRAGGGSARDEMWALRDVDLVIEPGEVVGLIGRNGAGKSTLLKVLSRITPPTHGSAVLRGRVGSLLEVGTGFHPELSGRENIYLNGALLGMQRKEIQRSFDDIVAFSEVERFLDTPVKRYSSGMYVRLAFAVAAHLRTEILLVDEVLAVGDAGFQRKSLGKMGDVASEGRTVVLVSHNMAAIESLCSRAVLLAGGAAVADGPSRDVIARYVELVDEVSQQSLDGREDRTGDGRIRFTKVTTAVDGTPSPLVCGSPGEVRLATRCTTPVKNVHVSMALYDSFGRSVAYLSNEMPGDWFDDVDGGELVCDFDKVALLPGLYTATLYMTANGHLADWVQDAARLEVLDGDFYGSGKLPPDGYGSVALTYRWHRAGGGADRGPES